MPIAAARSNNRRYPPTVEVLEQHPDGGATIRLSKVELGRMFNGLVQVISQFRSAYPNVRLNVTTG